MLTSLLQHFKQEIRRELFVRQVRADHRLEEVEVGVADDSEKALGAARLVHDAYVARGILRPHPTGFHVGTHAASLSNWTFVATHDRSAIGTISLVIDSDAGLPMDRVYGCELTRLRRRSSCLAEVGALAVTPEFRHSGIIMLLMSATLRKAYDLAVNRLVIAIHPKAEPFYRDGLLFERIGKPSVYPGLTESARALALATPPLHTLADYYDRLLTGAVGGSRAKREAERSLDPPLLARAAVRHALRRARPDMFVKRSVRNASAVLEAAVA